MQPADLGPVLHAQHPRFLPARLAPGSERGQLSGVDRGSVFTRRRQVEWDAKGPRAARALIALLSSSLGLGVSGLARCWAGRIAVTEHIPGLSALSPVPTFAARGRVMPTRAWLLGGPLGWIMPLTGDRLVASWTVSERPRQYAPSGEWSGRAEWMRFAGLIHRRVRILGGPADCAACGGNLTPAVVATQGGAGSPLGCASLRLRRSRGTCSLRTVAARRCPRGVGGPAPCGNLN
jgi:hypothetical protein